MLVLLDAGPLGLATNPRESDDAVRCKAWLKGLLDAGSRVAVPSIADYEVRRELLRAGKAAGLRRLDALVELLGRLPITDEVLARAAELWAQARREGRPTADAQALDADAILAATALLAAEDGYEVVIATTNVGHLSRYADARQWDEIATVPEPPLGDAVRGPRFPNARSLASLA